MSLGADFLPAILIHAFMLQIKAKRDERPAAQNQCERSTFDSPSSTGQSGSYGLISDRLHFMEEF